MYLRLHGVFPNRRTFRPAQAAAAVVALLCAVLASGNRLLTAPFQLDRTAIDFGQVPLGTSRQDSISVRNTGPSDLRIDSISISGADVAPFRAEWVGCRDAVVPPNAACSVRIVFDAATERKRAAVLAVASGAGRRTVQLTGSGVLPAAPERNATEPPPELRDPVSTPTNPVSTPTTPSRPPVKSAAVVPPPTVVTVPEPVISIRLTPSPAQFGEVRLGSGADRDFTITSAGNTPAAIGQVEVVGEHGSDFRVVDDYCSNRRLISECRFRISFLPKETGTHRAALLVPYTSGRAPESAVLEGTAAPPLVPVADLQPARVELTRRDPQHSIELRDAGDGVLLTREVALAGKNPEDFSLDRRCENTKVTRNDVCIITVTFLPDRARKEKHKTSSAMVSVTDNAAGSPHTVELIGTEGSSDHKRVLLRIFTGLAAAGAGYGIYEATHSHPADTRPQTPPKNNNDKPATNNTIK